jgi:hypothetical protein
VAVRTAGRTASATIIKQRLCLNPVAMKSDRELKQLLKSRSALAAIALPLLAISIWCLAVILDFLRDRKDFDGFDWFVFLFFTEFFSAAVLLGTLLLTCAIVDPPWLHKLLIDAARHVRWLSLLFFVSLIVVGAVGGLIVLPCLVAFGIVD